ncbi:MAG: M23 family metallopeptidase [bacterium]|nr:M23 family metallopeptidase [bacterium]
MYSATSGTAASLTTSGACGIGVVINGHYAAQHTYCHGLPGGYAVAAGTPVDTHEMLMLSASTGNSTGPRLHFSIRIGGQERCPQPLFVSIAEDQPLEPGGLPRAGCTS